MKITLTPGWQVSNMSFEWRCDWNRESLSGFAGLDPNFVSSQVDVVPVQSCQISQPLPGVESEEDQASPLFIGHIDHTSDLRKRERPASALGSLANGFHKFARALDDAAVPLSRAENELGGLRVMIGRGSARFLGSLVAELGNQSSGSCRQIELSRWPQEFEKLRRALTLLRRFLYSRVGVWIGPVATSTLRAN